MELNKYAPGRDGGQVSKPEMQQSERSLPCVPESGPDLAVLLKILEIEDDSASRPVNQPQHWKLKKTLRSQNPQYDRIILIGCDNSAVDHQKSRNSEPLYLRPTALAFNYGSTPSPGHDEANTYINDFICETFGRRLIYEVLPSLPLAAQLVKKKLESSLDEMVQVLKEDMPEVGTRRS
jgi:hypothetical protein